MSNTTHRETPGAGRVSVAFAALDPYVERNIPVPKEVVVSGSDWVKWGKDNKYPDYLLGLYDRSTTLRAVIDGTVDYILGDEIRFRDDSNYKINRYGDTVRDLCRDLATSLKQFGGFAIQVIRSNDGAIVELYAIELRYLRTNKDATVFYYSEEWGNKSGVKKVTYPAFNAKVTADWPTLTDDERERNVSSIYYYRQNHSTTYPKPCYYASIPACEIEANIDNFHLNALENGFTSSAVISFLNGLPSDEEKKEIERNVNEKFSGHQNAARIMINFADDKDHAVQVDELKVEDFGDRYNALEKSSRQKIFTAFRANPNLFGIPTESLGFSSEEYESAFKLFNRTQIKPAQQVLTDVFVKIFGEAILTISPFSLEGSNEANIS